MNKKIILGIVLTAIICLSSGYFLGSIITYPYAYNDGGKAGYEQALVDISTKLQEKGITLDWHHFENGTYQFTVTTVNGELTHINIAINLYLVHYDKFGNVITTDRGVGTFTNNGKNWTEQMLTNNSTSLLVGQTGGYYNASYPLSGNFYLGDATTAGSSTTSLVQPTETQSDGMGRALATNTVQIPSIGTIYANVTKTCVTAGITINEWGLYYQAYSATDTSRLDSLIAYDSTPGSKNYAVADTSAEGWTFTLS